MSTAIEKNTGHKAAQARTEKSELTTSIVQGTVAGLALILLTVILMYYSGDPLGILGRVGVDGVRHEKTGVYLDCSVRANKNHSYCQGKNKGRQDNSWENRRRGATPAAPFGLH